MKHEARIERLTQREWGVELTWHDGSTDRYHFVWLRDHLPDPSFFNPATGERLVDAHSYLPECVPGSVDLDESGALVVAWPGLKAPARYAPAWLRANSYDAAARNARDSVIPAASPWRFNRFLDVPFHDYEAMLEHSDDALSMLSDFRTFGFAVLEGAPAREGVVETLTQWLGYTREVAFGRIREIRSEPAYDNVAFTSRNVPPHIDGTNYIYPYEVQFLHCIVNQAKGGDSTIVDGFAAADRLRNTAPDAFAALARIKVGFTIGAGSHDIRHNAPVIELNRDGSLRTVRFSNQQRRVLSVPFDEVEPFYEAYGEFSRLIADPRNQLRFRFRPGDVLMFDNHRTLHARRAFDPTTGHRHLQLATTDMDMVDSKIRLLLRETKAMRDIDRILTQSPVRQ